MRFWIAALLIGGILLIVWSIGGAAAAVVSLPDVIQGLALSLLMFAVATGLNTLQRLDTRQVASQRRKAVKPVKRESLAPVAPVNWKDHHQTPRTLEAEKKAARRQRLFELLDDDE